jgi:hypothetical protein
MKFCSNGLGHGILSNLFDYLPGLRYEVNRGLGRRVHRNLGVFEAREDLTRVRRVRHDRLGNSDVANDAIGVN